MFGLGLARSASAAARRPATGDAPRPGPRPLPPPSSDLLRRANRNPAPRNALLSRLFMSQRANRPPAGGNARSSRSGVAYSGRRACSKPVGRIPADGCRAYVLEPAAVYDVGHTALVRALPAP